MNIYSVKTNDFYKLIINFETINYKMRTYILFILYLLVIACTAQSPPQQPTSGPGGIDYIHGDVIFSDFTNWLSADGYWLFEPDAPKPDSADVVVFNHGYGVFNPGPYAAWIEHLVKKGHIVIFPKYQLNDASLPNTYTPNAINGIQDAFTELNTNPTRVKPRMEHFAIIGHSYGGVITANLVTEYAAYGTPKPQCFMLCQPGTGGINSGRINSYVPMDTDYNALIVVGENDIVVGNSFGREIFDSTLISTTHKNYITHLEDNYSSPVLEATHNEPLAADNAFDGGTVSAVITGGYIAAKTDAVDFYCYWKLADALLSCTFYGTDCQYAFGDTDEQRFMGNWSDGTQATDLVVEPSSIVTVEESKEDKFRLYPNPANDFMSIEMSQNYVEYEIKDIQGRLIDSGMYFKGDQIMLPSHLGSGTYHLLIKNNDLFKVFKFIKN